MSRQRRSGLSPRTGSARIGWPRASRETSRMQRKSCTTRSGAWSRRSTRSEVSRLWAPGFIASWRMRPTTNSAAGRRRREVSLDEALPVFDERGRHVGPTADWSARLDDPSIQTELRLALTAAINELPAVSRTTLVLRDVEGLSNVQIAEVLGISVPAVKTRVHRARLFLRKQLGDVVTTLNATTATGAAS